MASLGQRGRSLSTYLGVLLSLGKTSLLEMEKPIAKGDGTIVEAMVGTSFIEDGTLGFLTFLQGCNSLLELYCEQVRGLLFESDGL